MECRLCGYPSTHKHGKAPNGSQRYFCHQCKQTFNERFDTLYYHRQVMPEPIRQVLQAPSEGSSLRGISRTTGLAYNTVVRGATSIWCCYRETGKPYWSSLFQNWLQRVAVKTKVLRLSTTAAPVSFHLIPEQHKRCLMTVLQAATVPPDPIG